MGVQWELKGGEMASNGLEGARKTTEGGWVLRRAL